MNHREIAELVDKLTTLSNKANNWDKLIEFFENNKDIDKHFPELKEDYKEKEFCFGKANIIIRLINELLIEIKDK
jgi:hypothetical protein